MENFPTDFTAISGRCNTHFVLFSVIFGFFHVRSLKAEILHVWWAAAAFSRTKTMSSNYDSKIYRDTRITKRANLGRIVEDQWHNGRIPAVCSSTWPCAPIYTYVYVLCSCLASFSAVVVLILSPFHIDFLHWSLDYWDPLGSDINKNDNEKIQNKIKTCTTTRETSRNINGRWSDIIALDRVVGRWP